MAALPQCVWGDVLALERWALLLRGCGVLADDTFYGVVAQGTSAYAWKHRVFRLSEVFP